MPDPAPILDQAIQHLQSRRFAEAEELLQQMISHDPQRAEAWHIFGILHAQQGRTQKAIECLHKALCIAPDSPALHTDLGNVLKLANKTADALAAYDKALALDPDNVAAHGNRANVLKELNRFSEAQAGYETALRLNPDFVDAHSNLGLLLIELGQFDESVAHCRNAIQVNPESFDAHNHLGLAQLHLGLHDRAIECFRKALTLKPGHPEATFSLACCLLLKGEFTEGWALYEWRRRFNSVIHESYKRFDSHREWDGLCGPPKKTLLIWSEQGLGDTLQFCRYAQLVADPDTRVFLEVQQPLKSLLATSLKKITILGHGDPLPDFDFHCPLLTLPKLLAIQPEHPRSSTPYLFAEPGYRGTQPPRPCKPAPSRIGVVWSGNPHPFAANDHRRSIPFTLFKQLFSDEYEWVSLQKEVAPADQSLIKQTKLQNCSSTIHDFADTAALIETVDLVISIDTSVAHLAGAMGKPTWTLLPYVADWRWLLDREDSPWYPTMRLFRQPAAGDWPAVLHRVKTELQKWPDEK